MKPRRLSPPGSVMIVSRFLHKGAEDWGGGGSGFPYPLSPWNKTIPDSRASYLHPVQERSWHRVKGEQDCSGLGALPCSPCPSHSLWPWGLCSQSSQGLCHSPFAVTCVTNTVLVCTHRQRFSPSSAGELSQSKQTQHC